jgi:hypothetical protein
MKKQFFKMLFLASTLFVAACDQSVSERHQPSNAAPYNLTLSIAELMDQVIDPAADVVWDSISWVSTTKGEVAKAPKNEQEWERVRSAAATVMEASNLLMIEPRAKDHDGWYKAARLMGERAKIILAAVKARDVEAVFASGSDLDAACEACHIQYAHFDQKSSSQ